MEISYNDFGVCVENVPCLNIALCLDCGQAFRFKETEKGHFHGVAFNKVLDITETEAGYVFENVTKTDFENIWKPYFDLDRDYEKICKAFDDEHLIKARDEFYGIRILKQEPWEALCSFIISQNNNIPRIKGIIERLCENFGKKIGENDYAFPSYEILSEKTVEDLSVLRAGFRAKYIIDAAQKVKSGEVDLYNLHLMPIEQAREELIKIKGVGAKVAECTLLYGVGMVDAFPVDVWVKRIMSELYPNGLPECTKGVEGIAQQYLFHWRRMTQEFQNR